MAIDSRTPIPTTKGWLPASKLQAGDEIFGYDGYPVKVTLVQEYTPQKCYKVVLKDGLTINADAKTGVPVYQYWERLTHVKWRRTRPKTRAIRPKGIIKLFDGRAERSYMLAGQPIKPPAINLPVDPYTLGRWIMLPTQAKRNKQTQVTRNLIEVYPTIPNLIPEEYLFASFEQRLALLRGIISMRPKAFNRDRLRFEFRVKTLPLTKQVINLVESLGIRMWIQPQKTYGAYYKIVFETLIRLSDDQLPPKDPKESDWRKVMRTIEIAPRPCTHIQTDSTHNTILIGEGFLPVSL